MNDKPVEKTGEKNSQKKLRALWADNRPYKQRLLISAVLAFALCFTFLFFGPVELTAFSSDSLSFSAVDITPIMAIFAAAVFVVLALLLSVLKGRIFNYVVSGLFAVTVCGYIQGNFLNGELGALTGDGIDWHYQKGRLAINLIIWFVLCLIPFVLLYFNKKVWKRVVAFVSVALVVMQAVPLVGIYSGTLAEKPDDTRYYLSSEGMFNYSAEHNTIVFLLDRLDYDYVQRILDDDPNFFDPLDGFISYTNAISEFARTKPAANFMLTNCEEYAYNMPAEEYFDRSWDYADHNILSDLSDAGYEIDLYTELGNMFGTGKTAEPYVSNLSVMTQSDGKLNVGKVLRNLTFLSVYRYAPTTFKPFFWTYTDAINYNAYLDNLAYEIDETNYAAGIGSFTAEEEQSCFKFYHFLGPHEPFLLNADGTKSEVTTSALEQAKGSFQILFNAISEMKRLGIYEDAGIIITADHGRSVDDYEPVQKATRIGLFCKPPGKAGTPLETSAAPISFKNLPATILKYSGIDYANYGRAIDEIGEDEQITRTFYKAIYKRGRERELYIYEIIGDAAIFANWKIVEVIPIEDGFY